MMNVSFRDWDTYYKNFENQVNEFNSKIQKSMLSEEELDTIYTTVNTEVKRLTQLSKAAKKREEEIKQGTCCSSTSKSIWMISLLNTASKVCAVTGAIIGIYETDLTTKWVGAGIFTLGELFDLTTSIAETKLFFRTDEMSQLAQLNKKGVKHAKIFKHFLKKLREIKSILEDQQSLTNKTLDHTIIDLTTATKSLDQRITACLKEYEDLPNCYRHEEVYCRIISHLIQRLPSNDSLRKGLEELEPNVNPNGLPLSDSSDQPLPVRYLPTRKKKLGRESVTPKPHASKKWKNEEQGRLKEEGIDIKKTQLKYSQKVAYLQQVVSRRFKLSHNIKFLETSHGWRIDTQQGIRKVLSTSHKISSSEQLEETSGIIINSVINSSHSQDVSSTYSDSDQQNTYNISQNLDDDDSHV